jgi:hypothetical protein
LVSAALFAMAAQSSAVVLYSTGFEGPTFTAGPLPGQDGWQRIGGNATFATIQGSVVNSGSQALRMDTSPISSAWLWKDLTYSQGTHGPVVTTTASFLFDNNAQGNSAFGFDAYDVTGANRVAGLFVGGDGLARLIGSDSLFVDSAVTLTANTWYTIGISINFATGAVTGSVNGNSLGISTTTNQTTLGDVDLYVNAFGVGTGTSGGFNNIYVDNYMVQAVPEPATMAALGLGVAALIRRRRKNA